MAKFFIERPVFAWVLAIIMMLCGLLSIANLPVAQYPSIAPPTVSIQVNYPVPRRRRCRIRWCR
jgi:multidrug efflux pump